MFALAIQAPLLQRDWTQIAQLTWHWNTPATNPAARYLDASFHIMHQGTTFWQRLKLRFYRLCCWDQSWVRRLVQQIEADQHHAAILLTSAQPRARLWLPANLSSDEVDALSCSDTEQQYWQQRAQELGLWQAEESCQHLQQQYHQYLAQRAGISSRLSAAQLDALDQQEAQLQLLCQRIAQRRKRPQKFNPLREWLDWLAIADVLRQLASHAATQQAAFFSVHSILWGWIAYLLNKRDMRCLARCMVRYCLPLAKASGCKEFHLEFFNWR